jgi:hypothetical protein
MPICKVRKAAEDTQLQTLMDGQYTSTISEPAVWEHEKLGVIMGSRSLS